MNRFAIAQATTYEQAGALLSDARHSLPVLKAGGMDVVDHLKEGLLEPDLLINIKKVRREGVRDPIGRDGARSLRIEAGATLAQIGASPLFAKEVPAVAQAVSDAATPQVRNVATAAGNLLQRPRCWYYRNEQFHCLKKGGHTCFAFDGENRYHAIFGDGPCYIVHPSNLAVGLFVCNARAHLIGSQRQQVSIADLFHTPEQGLLSEHTLDETEIITHLTLDPAPRSGFHAIKEKRSFDWPLVMAAAALELDGDRIESARICAGAVAPVPWPLPRVEAALRGVSVRDTEALRDACAVSTVGAQPLSENSYKVSLLPVAVRRAVLRAAGRKVEMQL